MLLLLLPLIVNCLPNVDSLLLSGSRCIPTAIVKGPCHKCTCSIDGMYQCQTRPCDRKMLANITNRHADLPEITEGESCIPGYLYKMSCNTCRCLVNDALICTKMACLSKEIMEKLMKKKPKPSLREGKRRPRKKTLPELPIGNCKPGKLYMKGCQICFCTNKNIAECSKQSCNKKMPSFNMHDPEYFESAFPVKDRNKLSSLPHMGSKCDPGTIYKVDCNICFCRDNSDLTCTRKLCPTAEGYNHVAAHEKSGIACKKGYVNKLNCIECECVISKTECKAIDNCKQRSVAAGTVLSSRKEQVLDVNKDKCTPNMIYRVHCNKCFCQSDGSLRCTQKLCLTNSESKKLEAQRLYLEKFGL